MNIKSDILSYESHISIEFEKDYEEDVSTENVKDINVGIRKILEDE